MCASYARLAKIKHVKVVLRVTNHNSLKIERWLNEVAAALKVQGEVDQDHCDVIKRTLVK